MGNPNLFVTLHEALHRKGFDRIGTGWENTLIEQLAFLLVADDETRDSVVRLVMREAAEPATRVETQLTVGGDCPDLAIHLEIWPSPAPRAQGRRGAWLVDLLIVEELASDSCTQSSRRLSPPSARAAVAGPCSRPAWGRLNPK